MKSFSKYLLFSMLCLSFAAFTSCKDTDADSTIDPKVWSSTDHIDNSVKPGDDFFNYAVGSWLKANPLTGTQDSNGANQELTDLDDERFKDLWDNVSDEFRKNLYQNMTNTSLNEKSCMDEIKKDLALIQAATNENETCAAIGKLVKEGYSPLIKVSSFAQDDSYCSYLNSGYFAMMLTDAPEAYKAWVTYCFETIGYDAETAAQKTENALSLERKVKEFNVLGTNEEGYWNKAENYKKLHRVSEVCSRIEDTGIYTLLKNAGLNTNTRILKPELQSLIASTDWKVLKDYTENCIIQTNLSYLPESLLKKYNEITGVSISVKDSVDKFIRQNLKYYVNKMYANQYKDDAIKTAVSDMANNIKATFRNRLQNSTWMNANTKNRAIAKLEAMQFCIGYPDTWEDSCAPSIDLSQCLCANMRQCRAFAYDFNVLKQEGLKKREVQNIWRSMLIQLNLYDNNGMYDRSLNAFILLLGIMDKPVFMLSESDAYNYATMGSTTIGHEICHGYDSGGAEFNEEGNIEDWWTAEDKAAFKKKQDMLVELYNKIKVLDGLYINGTQTLNENMADLGGIEVSYQALVNKRISEGYKGSSLDDQKKKFFMGQAEAWRGNTSTAFLQWQIKKDPHSPDKARVNGIVNNMDDWYSLFGVTSGDAMYLPAEKRVYLW